MKILVTGSNGQLGNELKVLSKNYDFEFIFSDKEELDICSLESVLEFFSDNKINYCINCAAYTAVDKAETDTKIAYKVNLDGAENLAKACKIYNSRLIHISTDYVYHNNQNTPFVETDSTSPQGIYAASKLAGDDAVLKENEETIILRTSWVYSAFGNNFVKTMQRLGSERDALNVIFDQIGSPTYAADLADAILKIIAKAPIEFRGIYHYSNEGVCSWYDFAIAIFELSDINCNVSPILTSEYPTPAKRPHFSLLNKNKFKETFKISIPYWRDALKKCIKEISNK